MKFNSLHRLPLLLAIAICVVAMATSPSNWDKDAARKKAEYIFIEAQNAYCQEKYDDYVTLTKRAYDLDGNDLDIAAEWAMIQLGQPDIDSLAREDAYRMIERRFRSNPSDYIYGASFANLSRSLRKYDEMLNAWQTLDSIYPTYAQPSRELAQAYLIKFIFGDSAAFDKALAIYDRMERGTGKNINISAEKIRAFMLKNDTTAFLNEVNSLLEGAPNDPNTSYFAGLNYSYIKDYDNALKYFDRTCQLDSTFGEAYAAKANIYMQLGDSTAYDREVFLALQSPNLEIDAKTEILHSYVSQLYQDRSQEPRIRQLFEQLELMHPGEAVIYDLYSSYLYALGYYQGAAEQITYSIALNPAEESNWAAIVQIYADAGDYDNVIKYATDAIKKFPETAAFPITAAIAYSAKDETSKALEVLDSVDYARIKNPTAASSIHSYRGDILAMTGDTAKALEAYDRAIELNPNNFMALNNAAYFMAETNRDLDKAEQYSARTVRNESDNPTYLDTYAWIFFKKKDYAMARNYIDMTLNLYKASVDSVKANIENADEQSTTQGAEEKEDEYPSADVLEHAGDIYFMNGEPAKALEFWKQAYLLDPENECLGRKVKHKTYFYN